MSKPLTAYADAELTDIWLRLCQDHVELEQSAQAPENVELDAELDAEFSASLQEALDDGLRERLPPGIAERLEQRSLTGTIDLIIGRYLNTSRKEVEAEMNRRGL